MSSAPNSSSATPPVLPSIGELGDDLLRINRFQRYVGLATPFGCVAAYAFLATRGVWPLAVACLVYLSFVTYGSISHDLVHRTLGLPRRINDFFLTTIELLTFRSGHAYRLVHLHHHARFPNDEDVEGAAAKMSAARSILEGVVFQPKIMIWAMWRPGSARPVVLAEVILSLLLFIGCFAVLPWTPIPAVYAILMIVGSWIIPLITSHIPHNPAGHNALTQTRLFRGRVASVIALRHLYHLEHHLYPMVPHHNWPKLASRLDPYFKSAGVRPVVIGF